VSTTPQLSETLLLMVASLCNTSIVVALTIEPNKGDDPSVPHITRPIRGIMTSFGYVLPHSSESNRMSIWFTGGMLEVNDEKNDLEEWRRVFGGQKMASSEMNMSERAHVLAARELLGAHLPDSMKEDGSMYYYLTRPIGGHDAAYCDILYMDESLRIVRGHHGTIYVFTRLS